MTYLNTCKKGQPRVMIAALVSNQANCLDRFLNEIDNLNYPKEFITYAFLTGNNDDDTSDILAKFESTHQGVNLGDPSKGKVWLKGFDLDKNNGTRFFRLATLRNMLIDQALRNEDYVLVIDSDIVHIPDNLITELMSVKEADVVAPLIFIEEFREYGNTYFYDRLAFIKDGINFDHFYPYIPGYTQLPDSPVLVDSVGACYLVSANVFRAGARCILEKGDESEQVTFCDKARECGFKIAVHPQLSALHFNGEPHGIIFE